MTASPPCSDTVPLRCSPGRADRPGGDARRGQDHRGVRPGGRGLPVLGEYTDNADATIAIALHPPVDDDDAHQQNWLRKTAQCTARLAHGGMVYADRDWLSSLSYAYSIAAADGGALLRSARRLGRQPPPRRQPAPARHLRHLRPRPRHQPGPARQPAPPRPPVERPRLAAAAPRLLHLPQPGAEPVDPASPMRCGGLAGRTSPASLTCTRSPTALKNSAARHDRAQQSARRGDGSRARRVLRMRNRCRAVQPRLPAHRGRPAGTRRPPGRPAGQARPGQQRVRPGLAPADPRFPRRG